MAPPDVTTKAAVRADRTDAVWRAWRSVRDWDRRHAIAVDTVIAVGLFLACSGWVLHLGYHPSDVAYVAGLTGPLLLRRRYPTTVFAVMAAVALAQWLTTGPLLADGALLVALFTVASDASGTELLMAAGVLEIGVVLATIRWAVAGNHFKTFVFLSGMAFAAAVAGVAVRELRRQLEWLAERGDRLELERDQQASIAAAAERARIAREMHDVISHNLQVMVTLADAASVAQRSDPARAAEVMTEISGTGRQALQDMRSMLGLLREEEATTAGEPSPLSLTPQPGLGDLPALVERVRATGLVVSMADTGAPFELSASAGMTVYRIVQEALTNTLKHAVAPHLVVIELAFDDPNVSVRISDDGGLASVSHGATGTDALSGGHGLDGMSERAAAFGGTLTAGPLEHGGWSVLATLRGGRGEGQ